jgi:hypothetical protein
VSQQINLFNPIFRQQKKYLSVVTILQSLGLILLGGLLLSGYASYRSSRLAADAAIVNNQLAMAQTQLSRIEASYAPRKKSAQLDEEIKRTEAQLKSLQAVSDILQRGELGNTKGYANYLRAFARQIVDGLWLTGFKIYGAGTEIGLSGRALRPELVPIYIGRLKIEPIMQGKSFSALKMQVPQITDAGKGSGAVTTQPVSAGFIEFNLQSTGLSRQQAADAGAANK